MARGNAYGIPLIITANTAGAKKADKSLKSLIKNTKSFGLTSKLSVGAASVALTAYAKKSISTALADQKAQKTLAQTLKNVGESFATPSVTKYIDSLQRATGVSEDQLRPAFDKLITSTQSASKAQELLSLSLDISAATGKDAESVSAALSKAYLGNNTSLSKLGVGLTKTELKSMSFEQVTKKLSVLFAGQAQTAAQTYSGQLDILKVAADEASETIGYALVESIVKLGGQNGAKDLATQMQTLADNTANVITGITVVLNYFKKLDSAMPSWLKTTINFLERFNPLGQAKEALKILNELGAKEKALEEQRKNNFSDRGMNARAADIADKKAKALLATNKGITKEKKAQAASDKLKGMFDLDAIQIAAALKGKISDLDRASLLAMQALKTADKNDDISALKELEQAKISADAADRSRKIAALQDTINLNKLALADVESTLAKIAKLPVPILGNIGGITPATPNVAAGQSPNYFAPVTPITGTSMPSTNTGAAPVSMGDPFAAARAALPGVNFNPPAVEVTVNANTIADPDQLTRLIQAGIQAVARNGWSSSGSASGF
jgi:hypothetical protein